MRIIGQKHFELNNHLGNVMSVVTDKLVDVTTSNAVTDALPMNCERTPSLFAAYDYYPFVRKTKRGTSHRFSIPLFYGSLLMPERYREETGIQCTPVTTTVYQPTWIDYADYDISGAPEFAQHFEFPLGMEGTFLAEELEYKIQDANQDGEERMVAFNLHEVSTADVARLQVGINNNGNYDVQIELAQLADETWEVLASTSISTETMIELIAEMPGNNPVRIQFRTTDANFRLSHIGFTRRDMLTGTESRLICNSDSEFGKDYRFGYGGHEKDNEIKGVGNSVDMGARMLDTRLGRTGSLDPKMGLYPGISPYAYALNTPINAIDPDGKLVIFVNGYRPCLPGVNVYREVKRNDKVFRGDKLGYWSGVDKKFMDRMGDHNAVYADGDAPTLTAGNKMGFNARVAHGRKAGQDLISKINSGKVVLQKNDKGEVIESIKVVAHSMGYAYSLGMIKELEKAGYKVEVSYNLAPENPKGGDIPANVNRSVQYGSGPDDPWYQQDRIAPQSDINNVDENAYIPDKNANGEDIPKGPVDSHLGKNFGKWIFGIEKGKDGYVAPRQDTQATDQK